MSKRIFSPGAGAPCAAMEAMKHKSAPSHRARAATTFPLRSDMRACASKIALRPSAQSSPRHFRHGLCADGPARVSTNDVGRICRSLSDQQVTASGRGVSQDTPQHRFCLGDDVADDCGSRLDVVHEAARLAGVKRPCSPDRPRNRPAGCRRNIAERRSSDRRSASARRSCLPRDVVPTEDARRLPTRRSPCCGSRGGRRRANRYRRASCARCPRRARERCAACTHAQARDSSLATKRVPIDTASAPRPSAATIPRPVAIPPAAITGSGATA